MRKALTIAGSDSCGGAGIQADIKTMTMNGVYAMSAVTALTAQNTTGVTGIMEASPQFLEQQLDAVFEDIFPDAVKIGMVSSAGLIKVIGEIKLVQHSCYCLFGTSLIIEGLPVWLAARSLAAFYLDLHINSPSQIPFQIFRCYRI